MTATILDGKRIADDLLDGLKAQVDVRVAAGLPRPGLAVVLVGQDPASQSYVRNKRRAAQKVGIQSVMCATPANFTGFNLPGQCATVGTRTPPSYTLPFSPRSGVLFPGRAPLA